MTTYILVLQRALLDARRSLEFAQFWPLAARLSFGEHARARSMLDQTLDEQLENCISLMIK